MSQLIHPQTFRFESLDNVLNALFYVTRFKSTQRFKN